MKKSLTLARTAARRGEVPVGALIVVGGKVVSKAYNLTKTWHDPTAHAELIALRQAAKALKNERLVDCDLYVTLEPCAMCAGAIVQSRVRRLIYGAKDPKAGACGSVLNVIPNKKLNHRPVVVKYIYAGHSSRLLRSFFRKRRIKNKRSLK